MPFFPVLRSWKESRDGVLGLLPPVGLWTRERRKVLLAYFRTVGGFQRVAEGWGTRGPHVKIEEENGVLNKQKGTSAAFLALAFKAPQNTLISPRKISEASPRS